MKSVFESGYRRSLHLFLLALAASWVGSARAATLTVTNIGNSGPGTLRDRIAAAVPGDSINFAVFGTMTLDSELQVAKNLTIQGPGVQFLRISGNNSTRVFHILSGTVGINSMTISDGRVLGTNGPVGSNGENVSGGGILVENGASLSMSTIVLSNNTAIGGEGGPQDQFGASGNGGNARGGAIASYGSLIFVAANMLDNQALGGQGGVVTDGAFPGAGGQGWGGGVYVEGPCTITLVTIAENHATAGTGQGGPGGGVGGGIYNVGSLSLNVSTIANNIAEGSGNDSGGGLQDYGTLSVQDCTIAGNQADFGGGIEGTGSSLQNTILGTNSAGFGPDASGSIVSADYNLIERTNGVSITPSPHDIIGQNPRLTPLEDNGGGGFGFTTLTMAPLPGSPVIDKGYTLNNGDQRNFPRPYDTTISNAGNGADIGAVEVHPTTLLVSNTNDNGAGSLRQALADNSGLGGGNTITFSGSVTGTITCATIGLGVGAPVKIRGPGPDLLAVSGNRASTVFTVLYGPTEISGLTIRDGLAIGAPGSDGHNGFDAFGGGIFSQSTLTLSNCVVRSNTVIGGVGGTTKNGMFGNGGQGYGGGLSSSGSNVVVINCTFEGNTCLGGRGGGTQNGTPGNGGIGRGGAIYLAGGRTEITRSSLLNNLAMGGSGGTVTNSGATGSPGNGYGGGLHSESTVTLFSSTIAGGTAGGGTNTGGNGTGLGGGIYSVGTLGMYTCTVASNSATGSSLDSGGGLYVAGTFGTTNSTIAANNADTGGGLNGNASAAGTIFGANTATTSPDVYGTINSYDYNLIQNFAGANILGTTTHVLLAQDPLLGPLQNNGGPTFTMALLPGSPAIDQGNSFGQMRDQRGFIRPYDLPSIGNSGNGADIGAYEFLPTPRLNIQLASNNNVVLSWSTDAADYLLQSVTNLALVNTWSNDNSARIYVGNQIYVTNAASGTAKFYRLNFPFPADPVP